ncbi:MAG: cupin domain-containing protein [Euryarchaeota archaeon]|nr:cupin domain-containing protein [Euryarchaeota archaeon]
MREPRVIKSADVHEFVAGDGTLLRELHKTKWYSLARARLAAGARSKKHVLQCEETYVILAGSGIMCVDRKRYELNKNDVMVIPPGAVQSLHANEDMEFLCIVAPPWKEECEEVLE